MAEPTDQEQVSKKVVYEHVSSTSSGNSVAAWVIIGILAVALIAYIVLKMT